MSENLVTLCSPSIIDVGQKECDPSSVSMNMIKSVEHLSPLFINESTSLNTSSVEGCIAGEASSKEKLAEVSFHSVNFDQKDEPKIEINRPTWNTGNKLSIVYNDGQSLLDMKEQPFFHICTSELHLSNPKKRKSVRLANKEKEDCSPKRENGPKKKNELSELNKTTWSPGLSIAQVMKHLKENDTCLDPENFQWIISNIKTKCVYFTQKFGNQFKAMRELNSYIESLRADMQEQWWDELTNTKYTTPRFVSGWQIIFGSNLLPICSLSSPANLSFLKEKKRQKRRTTSKPYPNSRDDHSQSESYEPEAQASLDVAKSRDPSKQIKKFPTLCKCDTVFKYFKAMKRLKTLKEIVSKFERERNSLRRLLIKRSIKIRQLREENKLLNSYRTALKGDKLSKQMPKTCCSKAENSCDDLNQEVTIILPRKVQTSESVDYPKYHEHFNESLTSQDVKVVEVLGIAETKPNLVLEECIIEEDSVKSEIPSTTTAVSKECQSRNKNAKTLCLGECGKLVSEIKRFKTSKPPMSSISVSSASSLLTSATATAVEESNVSPEAGAEELKRKEQSEFISVNKKMNPSIDVLNSSVSVIHYKVCHDGQAERPANDSHSSRRDDTVTPVIDIKRKLKHILTQLHASSKQGLTKEINLVKQCEEKLHDIERYVIEKNYRLNLYKREIIALQTDLINNEMVLKAQLHENELLSNKYDFIKKIFNSKLVSETEISNIQHVQHSDAESSDTSNYHSDLTLQQALSKNKKLQHDTKLKNSIILCLESENKVMKEETLVSSQALEKLKIQTRMQQSLIASFENEVKVLKEVNHKITLELKGEQEFKKIANDNYQKYKNKVTELDCKMKTLDMKSAECAKLKLDLETAKRFIRDIRDALGLENKLQNSFELSSCQLEEEVEQIKIWCSLIKKKIEENRKSIHSLTIQMMRFNKKKGTYLRGNKLLRKKLKNLRMNIITLRSELDDVRARYDASSLDQTHPEFVTESLIEERSDLRSLESRYQHLRLKNNDLTKHLLREKQLTQELTSRIEKLDFDCQKLATLLKQEHTEASRQLELQLAMFCSTAERYREQIKRIEQDLID